MINLKSTIDDFIINDKRAFFTLNPSNAFGLPDLEGHFWMVDLKFWNNNFPKIIFESWTNTKENSEINEISYKQLQLDLFNILDSLNYKIWRLTGADDMYLANHD